MSGKKGGPRTIHKDNSHPAIKIALRKWLLKNLDCESILDVYGGHGEMYKRLWNKFNYKCSEGDALEFLDKNNSFNYDIYDIDPYSSPYEALSIITSKSNKKIIGVVCTDGMLKRQAHMRGNFTKFIQSKCKWPRKDNTLMAAIYYNYPKFLRYVLSCVCENWEIEKLVVKTGVGFGKSSTVYFAAILRRE